MSKNNLSTGEFAKLCKTTKATLFHYEKLGLLKPKYVSGNGYRRYGMEQFFDFETIAILKETGSSLEEIMYMRDNLDEDNLLKILEEKEATLCRQREHLELREIALGNILNDLREAIELVPDKFMIRELEEEFLEVAPVEGGDQDDLAASIMQYASYMSSRNGNIVARASFGIILDESVLAGDPYHELFYFNRSDPNTIGAICKRAGKYLVVSHKGDPASHLDCLKRMGEWCSAHAVRVGGKIYAYDLASFLCPQTIENYHVKYVIAIEDF